MNDFEFRQLALTDIDLLNDFRSRSSIEISELTFTNLFAWRNSMPVFIADTAEWIAIVRVLHGIPWLLLGVKLFLSLRPGAPTKR